MVTTNLLPADIHERYEVREWRNATGILATAHRPEFDDIIAAPRSFCFYRSEVLQGGGRKSGIASRFDGFLSSRGWVEKKFETGVIVDGSTWASPTHKVDCFRQGVGLEIEWNNKDPFFDRDLNNFRLLFDLRVLDVGIILTRSSHLQTIFKSLGKKVADKYGASTTHMDKLLPRLEGGGGGGCPILAFGITQHLYVEDAPPIMLVDQEDHDDDSD